MTPGTVAILLVGSFTLIMAIFAGLVTWANWDLIVESHHAPSDNKPEPK